MRTRAPMPFLHCTMAEVMERERLIHKRDTGTLNSHERIILRELMRCAVLPQYRDEDNAA